MRTARIEWRNGSSSDIESLSFDQDVVVELTGLAVNTHSQVENLTCSHPTIEFVDGDFYLLRKSQDEVFINNESFVPSWSNRNRTYYPLTHEDTIVIKGEHMFHFFEPAEAAGKRFVPFRVNNEQDYSTQPLVVTDIKFIAAVTVFKMMHKMDLIISIARKVSCLSQRPVSIHPFTDITEEKFAKNYSWLNLSKTFRDEQAWLPMKPPSSVSDIQVAERFAIDDRLFTFRERVCLQDVGTICYTEGEFLDGTKGYQYAYVLAEEFEAIYEKFSRKQTVSLVDNHYAKPLYTGVGKPTVAAKKDMISGYQISSNNSYTVIIVA